MGKLIFHIAVFLRTIGGDKELEAINATADEYFDGCVVCGATIISSESGYGCQWGVNCHDCTAVNDCFPGVIFVRGDDGCTNIPYCSKCHESRNQLAKCA